MNKERLFKEIIIWKPVDEKSVERYRCFEILSEGKFFVAQRDHFHEDFTEKEWKQFDNYFFESISGDNFDEMATEACQSVEEAIVAFDSEFE